MSQIMHLLKSVDTRLARIELSLSKPNLKDALIKTHYSCADVAGLTKLFGTKPAETFTVRLACSDGRIPDAVKFDDGHWRIPRDAVLRIISEGLPPERRQHS
jgi:hypothetical protein